SFILPTANLSINVEDPVLQTSEDPGSGVHLGVLRNGTTNITFQDSVEFDPGLTTSITHNLSVWFNDSVSNTNRTLYQFKVDGLPPVLTSASPSNDTFITNTTSILLEFDDRGPRGGIGRGTTLITVYNGSKNLTVHEGDTFDPGWTSEGEHRLIIWKNDSLGNTNATRLNYTVDNTPPQTTDNHTQNINNNGWNGWYTTNRSVKITATDNFNPVAIQACIYDTAFASSCSPSHQGSPNITLEAGCPDGEACILKLQYRTNDSAGNLEQKQTSINISIDRADPAIEFQRPTSGSTVGGVVEFDTHLSDVGAGINDANYSIVNTTGTTTSIVRSGDLNASTGWSWNTSWDSTVDLSGTFDFNVSIKDRSGRIKTKNISITVDNGKPAVSIASPTGNYYRKDIPINIEAERPGAGNLKNHSYRIYNTTTGNVINWSNATGLTSSSHTFDLTVDIASLPDGNYTINSTAWDDSSQKGWASNTFVLDTAAPNLSVSAPANNTWQTGTTSITNIVEEQHKDRCVLQYRDDPGAAWQGNRTATCSGSDTFDTENCNDDSTTDCTVRLFAIDRAGNINATSISFSVDNSAPEASIDAPEKGWFNTDFTVEFTVRDDQGLRNRSYRINNSGWKPLNAPEIDVNISRYCRVQGSETCPVEVNATNKVNMTTTAVRKYSIDTSEPVFDSLTPGNNSNVSSGQSFTANYGDRVSGIKKARYYTANDAGSISSSFTPVWSQNDTRSLDLLIRDRAGNTITRNFSITVDDTDPVFHGFSPENNTNITPERNLTINVTDHYTAVVTGRYNRGSGNRTYTPNQSTEVAWSEGQQDVTVYASDAASPA
ncbi:MAG: hypothetical protein SVU32_01750, partial [Candidatus Nanohaloarchaea archaeon]|nr:hypothetical protein [Candidatus Nanohaloarchaea archaeon]